MNNIFTIISNSKTIEVKFSDNKTLYFSRNHKFKNNKNMEKYIDKMFGNLAYIINTNEDNFKQYVKLLNFLKQNSFKVVYY